MFGEFQDKPKSFAGLPLFVSSYHKLQYFIFCGFIICNGMKWIHQKTRMFIRWMTNGRWCKTAEQVKLTIPTFPPPTVFFKTYFACSVLTAIDIGIFASSMRFLSLSMFVIVDIVKSMMLMVMP